jgi:hypothetical protein
MLTFLVATPEDPLNVRTTHDGPLASRRMFIVGIRTRFDPDTVKPGDLSSPFHPDPQPTACAECGAVGLHHAPLCSKRK